MRYASDLLLRRSKPDSSKGVVLNCLAARANTTGLGSNVEIFPAAEAGHSFDFLVHQTIKRDFRLHVEIFFGSKG